MNDAPSKYDWMYKVWNLDNSDISSTLSRNSSVNKTGGHTTSYKVFNLYESNRGKDAKEFRDNLKRSCSKNETSMETPARNGDTFKKEWRFINDLDRNKTARDYKEINDNINNNSNVYYSVIENIDHSITRVQEEDKINQLSKNNQSKYCEFRKSNIKYQKYK